MAPHPLTDLFRELAKTLVNSADLLAARDGGSGLLSTLKDIEDTVCRALCDIREAVNSLRPINRLPTELLAHVFSLVPERRATKFGDTESWPYHFMNVSQFDLPISVCRHWRRIALNTPKLWADICILEEQVSNYSDIHRRFPHSPLNLFIERHDSLWVDRAVDLLRIHGPRIRLLHIMDLDGDFGQKALDAIRSLPTPNLRHCALVLRKTHSEERSKLLFSGYGASLHSLLLSGLRFLPSNSFPALRRLTLLLPHSVNWDMADLLMFLSRLPSLERCYLVFDRNIQEQVGPDLPVITLNVLRALSIGSYVLESDVFTPFIRNLYAHVSVPNVVHHAVDMCSVNDLPVLESCLIAPPGASYTQLMVYTSNTMIQALKFGRRDPTQTLSFRYSLHVFEEADIKALLSTSPLFSSVQECWLMAFNNTPDYTHTEAWLASLPFLPNLRGLVAAMTPLFQSSPMIFRYLAHTPDAPALCCLLETLCLCIQVMYRDLVPPFLAQLSAMLRSRREAGCPIRQVVLGFTGKADDKIDTQLRNMDGLVDELAWFWDVGKDFGWLRHVPSLVQPSSPIHVGWAEED